MKQGRRCFDCEISFKNWVSSKEYVVYCDSQSAMDLSKNATYHARTKHVDVRYHWIREVVEKNLMKLEKIHTDKNSSDMMTKVVSKGKLELCSKLAGLNS